MKMISFSVKFILIFFIFSIKLINTQRSSNGRHRTWSSEEEETPKSNQLMIDDNFVISQHVPSKNFDNQQNDTLIMNILNRSINLTPETLAAEILKVDLSKSNMLLVSSSPTYVLTNQTVYQENTKKEAHSNDSDNKNNIDFVHQTRRMLDPNLASKNCLSTLDCDLELNERCLLPENEEILYYDDLTKVQPYTTVYSTYLRKKSRNLKVNSIDKNTPICGCAGPSFVRNQHSGQCELIRVVELKFRLRTDRQSLIYEQNFEQIPKLVSKKKYFETKSNLHQLKLDALAQIDYVIKNSDSLQDIVHHFRLTNLTPLVEKNKNFRENLETEDNKKSKRNTRSVRRQQSHFIARGLLLLFSSEYTVNFDLLFTNEYCSTQNTLRLKAQEKMIQQALAATNQTMHFNTIRSADFWSLFNESFSVSNENNDKENQSDRIKYSNLNRSENRLIEMPFIHHAKKREIKETALDERYGLDVQLIQVKSDINICTLQINYVNEQLNEARWKYDLNLDDEKMNKNNNTKAAESEKKQRQFDDVHRFSHLTYCDDSRAYCESLPKSRAGYVCVCHSNLMDLSPLAELPGELCGVKCPVDYCGLEGFCHVRNAVGYYPNPDHDLAIQQRYLSTAGRLVTFGNGNGGKSSERNRIKLENSKKSKPEKENDQPDIDLANYQSIIDAHKKNQTLLRQRYYAAIYSVQRRFAQLFENINTIGTSTKSELKTKKNEEKFKFDYSYSFPKTPQLVTFYCTCPGWTMGSRCQFSGWMILLVLLILVMLLALITICTVSMLCAPGKSRRDSTKSDKSLKSNLNTTTSLTISETSSLDTESNSQLDNSQKNHNQFNNQANRQRRASEFVNDKRSSFVNRDKFELNKQSIVQPRTIIQSSIGQQKPEFNIIHATPPHNPKEAQKIQFIDTITEIPYESPYEKETAQISSKVQQMPVNIRKPFKKTLVNQVNRFAKSEPIDNERVFEPLYDSNNNHVYQTIDSQDGYDRIAKKETDLRQNKPITHVHNIYASAGELRVESDELDELDESPSTERFEKADLRSVGSQTSGFQSGDPSLAYLSAINLRQSLKQLQYDQQKAHFPTSNQLPKTSISGPIVWF